MCSVSVCIFNLIFNFKFAILYIFIITWYENIKENQEDTIKFYKWLYLIAYLHNYMAKIRNKKTQLPEVKEYWLHSLM